MTPIEQIRAEASKYRNIHEYDLPHRAELDDTVLLEFLQNLEASARKILDLCNRMEDGSAG